MVDIQIKFFLLLLQSFNRWFSFYFFKLFLWPIFEQIYFIRSFLILKLLFFALFFENIFILIKYFFIVFMRKILWNITMAGIIDHLRLVKLLLLLWLLVILILRYRISIILIKNLLIFLIEIISVFCSDKIIMFRRFYLLRSLHSSI